MELLIEIGIEELPAIPFLKEFKNIAPKWREILCKNSLETEFEFEFTPRRLVLIHKNFSEFQPDSEIVKTGAPKNIALKDGIFTKAALSFAKKCGISENELKFENVDGKEVLYYKKLQKGKASAEILGSMIEEFLLSLNFGRSMRWGNGEFSFIRPIRSVACLLDGKNVDFKIFGVQSRAAFFPHRNFGYELIRFRDSDEYFKLLVKNGIILKSNDRKTEILSEFEKIERENGVKIQIDNDLLNEVIAITEHPTALLGNFDESFLAVPKEVIITSMKENQRYFPVFENGKLSNHFVVVSNAVSDDNGLIIKGNEKVLRARLSDAMFFWQNDLKAEFSENKLKNVSYMDGLGSIYEKELRELETAKIFAEFYKDELKNEFKKDCFENEINRAIMLSKADLTSSMVGEFPELQGVMGSYYALYKNEHPLVARAIYEQYLPNGENSELPNGIFSSIIAISVKFETLIGLFSIGKIPNGNKDPYALRRAALGILKIVLNQNLNFDIASVIKKLAKNYAKFDENSLINFLKDRLYSLYDANVSVIKACINSGENDIKKLNSAIISLDEISKETDFSEKFATFKRLANIIKDEKIGVVNEALFENETEILLNSAFKSLDLNDEDCKKYLNSLFALKDKIDEFFDKVMINAEDKKIKANRIALIGQIYNAFLKVADIKEIGF